MPNCDFYAVGKDHKLILDFVFSLDDCEVYELSSPVDQTVAQFRSTDDIQNRYKIQSWDTRFEQSIHLQVYPRDACGQIVFEKVVFSANYKGPGSFRYNSSGWGLIQLYLESPRNKRLRPSHTNHNSEKRALAWEQTYPEFGPAAKWHWPAIKRWSRSLNRFIQKNGVAKHYSRVLLPEAKRLSEAGIELTLA